MIVDINNKVIEQSIDYLEKVEIEINNMEIDGEKVLNNVSFDVKQFEKL